MKKNEIRVGGHYIAKVGTNITTVRVDSIGLGGFGERQHTTYKVTNLTTGRSTMFRSAMKFRGVVPAVVTTIPTTTTTQPTEPEEQTTEELDSDEVRQLTSHELAADKSQRETAAETYTLDEDGNEVEVPQPIVVTVPTPVTPTLPTTGLASRIQQAKLQATAAPHVIVEARAGSGKTTCLVEGLKHLKGIAATITPSPQQQTVWDAMELSKDARTICFCAFNRSIADELKNRVPAGCEAMTMHSMGLKAVTKTFGRVEVSAYRVTDIIANLFGKDIRDLRKDPKMLLLIKATEELVGLCKVNLTEPTEEALGDLASYYDVDMNGNSRKVFELVPQVIERCKDPRHDGRIDYNDMIWLPVVLNLPVFRYDLFLVDELQDMSKCQQELIKKAGNRIIGVGDPCQSIYSFAGADSSGMRNFEQDLSTTPRGCSHLYLTVTRRCGKAIVKEANFIVPDFHAHEDNCAGHVGELPYPIQKGTGQTVELPWEEHYGSKVRAGDFVICRTNAPLVSNCFRFLRRGIKANIRGRDIGQGLIALVKKMNAVGINDLVAKITDWVDGEVKKEKSKRMPSETKITALADKAECIVCFTEDQTTVDGVIRKIENLFTDNKDNPGVIFTSGHKSKGLEAKRVFWLQPPNSLPPLDKMQEWERESFTNLNYVITTRSIEELYYVT